MITHLRQLPEYVVEIAKALGIPNPDVQYDETAESLYTSNPIMTGAVKYDNLTVYHGELYGGEPGWALEKTTIIPGVRTFRNGDPGYPDDADYDLVGTYKTLELLLVAMGREIAAERVESRLESYEFEKLRKEEEAWHNDTAAQARFEAEQLEEALKVIQAN
jgi:hypothetical protein